MMKSVEPAIGLYYYLLFLLIGKGSSVTWRQIGCNHLGNQDQWSRSEENHGKKMTRGW